AALGGAPFRSACLIVALTDPAANGAHRARVLAPAVRRLPPALGHRSGGLDAPDIRAAGDTKDTTAAKTSARDLQDGLAVDIERAAALLTGDVGHRLMSSTEMSITGTRMVEAIRLIQRSLRSKPDGAESVPHTPEIALRGLVAKEKSERRHADQQWRTYIHGEGEESFGDTDHFCPPGLL